MADQLRKSNRKRIIKSEQKPVAKRQKREKYEEAIIDEAAAAPITNICNELIDRIFDFLDIESLLNVAGTCKRLQIAAAAKFDHKYGKRCVNLDKDSHLGDKITTYSRVVNVSGLKYFLPFLRCFGAKIVHLYVVKMDKVATKADEHLDRYIQQYCADTLTKFSFQAGYSGSDVTDRVFSFDNSSKPFKNVTDLSWFGGDMDVQLPNWAKLFPNLRRLDMHYRGNCSAMTFPHLEHLSIQLTNSSKCFTSNSATKLLHANPQLKSLEICLGYEKNLGQLLNMLSKNPSLIKLEIRGRIKGVNTVALDRFLKKHPLLGELDFDDIGSKLDDAVILSRQLNLLQSLAFRFDDPYKCDLLVNQLDGHWKYNIFPGAFETKIVLSH